MRGFTLRIAAVLACGCGPSADVSEIQADKIDQEVIDEVTSGRAAKILVVFAEPTFSTQTEALTQADAPLDTHEEVIERLALERHQLKDGALAGLNPDAVEVINDFEHLPLMALSAKSLAGLADLQSRSDIVRIALDRPVELFLTESLSMIGQPTVAVAGHRGAGTSVVVLDTGLNYAHTAFGTCSTPGASGCSVAYVADIAASDGSLDDNGHGTNVAGIVLGVAPEAKVIGLDVFSGGSGMSSDIISGINWAIAHRAEYNIVAINMSLGSGGYTAKCTNDVFEASIQSAKAAGILSIVASGNSSYTDRISSPACAPSAVSVGAVYDSSGESGFSSCGDSVTTSGKVTCFSNSASFLSLLAPGAKIAAAGVTMSGTSQAAPHVAGAVAVLRGAFPSESVDQTVSRMTSNGVSTTDARNGITTPRLDLAAAATGCGLSFSPAAREVGSDSGSYTMTVSTSSGCSWSATSEASWITIDSAASGTGSGTIIYAVDANTGIDRTGGIDISGLTYTITQNGITPVAGISINNQETYTKSISVQLAISAGDASNVLKMCVSNTLSCSRWITYSTSLAWKLTSGNGLKNVYVWFLTASGLLSYTPLSASITLDVAVPTNGTATATAGDASVDLSWSGYTDLVSGIAKYRVMGAPLRAPTHCRSGTPLYEGSSTTYSHTGLTNGTTYKYRICAVDNAGNVSTGVVVGGKPVPETDGPVGTISIANGDTYTRLTSVILALSATDASTISHMCISNTDSCKSWVAYATTKKWTLVSGVQTKTVRVWFRDIWGNVSSSAASDSIEMDVTVPTQGMLDAQAGTRQVSFTWADFADAQSGIASYRLVFALGAVPATCLKGTPLAVTTSGTFVHTGLYAGKTYGYRLCAIDRVGNMSIGVAATVLVQ